MTQLLIFWLLWAPISAWRKPPLSANGAYKHATLNAYLMQNNTYRRPSFLIIKFLKMRSVIKFVFTQQAYILSVLIKLKFAITSYSTLYGRNNFLWDVLQSADYPVIAQGNPCILEPAPVRKYGYQFRYTRINAYFDIFICTPTYLLRSHNNIIIQKDPINLSKVEVTFTISTAVEINNEIKSENC